MAMNYTPIPFDFLEEMEELSDAEYGRLVRWGQHYHLTGEKTELRGNERFYAKRMQMQIDRYSANYEEAINKKREAGMAGASRRWQSMADDGSAISAMADDGKNGYTKTNTKTKTNTETNISSPNGERDKGRAARFSPPTVEEVRAYCEERKNHVDPETFVDHYQSNGWKVGGKSPMKDWKAAVRTWEKNEYNRPGAKNKQGAPAAQKIPEWDDAKAIEQLERLRLKMERQAAEQEGLHDTGIRG